MMSLSTILPNKAKCVMILWLIINETLNDRRAASVYYLGTPALRRLLCVVGLDDSDIGSSGESLVPSA